MKKAKGKKHLLKVSRQFSVNFHNSGVEQKLFSSSKTTRCVIVKSTETGLFLACKLSLQCALSTITYLVDVDRQKDGKKNCRKLNIECHVCSGSGPVESACEHGNKPSDSIKGTSLLD